MMQPIKRFLEKGGKIAIYSPDAIRRCTYLLKKGRIRNLLNYLWDFTFSKEEGLSIFDKLFYRRNHRLTPFPERIEVETTSICPYRCAKCEHTYWNARQKHMTLEEFKQICNQFPTLKAVSPTGIGACFTNPQFMEILRYLKGRGLFVNIFDEFNDFNDDKIRQIVKMGVDRIWISLDAATKETYNKVQCGLNFEKALGSMKKLIDEKRSQKSPLPEICFHFIVTNENYREMPQYLDLVKEITKGDDAKHRLIQFTRLIPFPENAHIEPPHPIPQDVMKEVYHRAGLYRFRIDFVNIPNLVTCPLKECTAWTVPFITVEGEYYPCCSLTERNWRNEIRPLLFGNVFQKDFKEIWNSRKFRVWLDAIQKNMVPSLCVDCTIFDTPNQTENREQMLARIGKMKKLSDEITPKEGDHI